MRSLCKYSLDHGGRVVPLITDKNNGLSVCNPSIFNDDGKLLLNIRGVNYTIHHCENIDGYRFPTEWGPLCYVRPDNFAKLATTNILATLDDDLNIISDTIIDTSELDITPKWEFTGLEDGRLVRWDGRLFLCGGRRDIEPNGDGKIELSEIVIEDGKVREIARFRVRSPHSGYEYLEKNWMPINDIPFHFVRWSSPLEIVKVDIDNLSSEIVLKSNIKKETEIRGGSSVVRVGDHYVCIVHECDFSYDVNRKRDAKYLHKIIVWDLNWNQLKITNRFKFIGQAIEFCSGMCKFGDDLLITFGYVDNNAYLLKISVEDFYNFIEIELST
jgi:hypothetical protein